MNGESSSHSSHSTFATWSSLPQMCTLSCSQAIEHAKWERWDDMFEIFDVYPGTGTSWRMDIKNCHRITPNVVGLLDLSFWSTWRLQVAGCQNMRPEFRKYAAIAPDANVCRRRSCRNFVCWGSAVFEEVQSLNVQTCQAVHSSECIALLPSELRPLAGRCVIDSPISFRSTSL